MCELLISTAPTGKPVATHPQRGDVVVIKPDNHVWGNCEQSDPQFRILNIPGMSVSDASYLLSPEAAISPAPDPWLQYRGFYLDLDHLTMKQALPEGIPLKTLVRQRPRLVNPTVIG
jgi:hypothetical protein